MDYRHNRRDKKSVNTYIKGEASGEAGGFPHFGGQGRASLGVNIGLPSQEHTPSLKIYRTVKMFLSINIILFVFYVIYYIYLKFI